MARSSGAPGRSVRSGGDVAAVVEATDAARVPGLEAEVAELRAQVDEISESMHEVVASLEVLVVDGYLVKVWPDLESGEWVAHCPTVRTVAQAADRDAVVEAIGSSIGEMLEVLAEMDVEQPSKDIP